MPGFSTVTRQEFIADILASTVNTQYTLPTNGGLIPNDRFIHSLLLTVEGRITNGNVDGVGVLADAPWSLIENIAISGYHRVRGQNEPFFNLRGADLMALNRIYTSRAPFCSPAALLGGITPAPLFIPNLSPVASDVYDFRFQLMVPFTPLKIPINSQVGYLLDAPNYDQLKMVISWADGNSLYSAGGANVTLSAFGSATGSPKIRVDGRFALAGASAYGFVPARTWRYTQENTSGVINNNGTLTANSREYNIPRGNYIRGVLFKTGVKATTATAGNNPYASYLDTAYTNIKVQRGLNKSIRFYESMFALKEELAMAYGAFSYPMPGYGLIDFAPNGRLSEALNTVGLVAGPSGDTDLFVQADVQGLTNQASLYMVEELRGVPRQLTSAR